jgi:hypothetical protein
VTPVTPMSAWINDPNEGRAEEASDVVSSFEVAYATGVQPDQMKDEATKQAYLKWLSANKGYP